MPHTASRVSARKKDLLAWPPFVFLLVALCALLWGSAFPCLKIGFAMLGIEHSTGGKLFFAAYRFFLAGLLIFAALAAGGKSLRLPSVDAFCSLVLLGVLQTFLLYFFFYIGLSNTTGVKAAIINGSGSFFLALFSHLWFPDDLLTRRKNLGLVLGFLGVVLVNFRRNQFDLEFRLTGEGFVILSALSSALGLMIVKRRSVNIHPPLMSAYQLCIGAVVLYGAAWLFDPPGVVSFSAASLLLLAYLSFLSAAAFSLWYVLIKHNPLSSIAVYRFLIPISGTLLSSLMLKGESLNWLLLASLLLVAVGMILTAGSPKARKCNCP